MVVALVLLGWLVIGAVVGLLDARRGGWHKGWVLSAILGPFAVPYGLQAYRRGSTVAPVRLDVGHVGPGLSMLVGIDGSEASSAAAFTAIRLFSDRVGRVVLATVLDFDTAASERPDSEGDWPERAAAGEALEGLADELAEERDHRPGTVLLSGDPADALEAFAAEEGYDVLVVGTRGRGGSKMVLGSCASRLGHRRRGVPVLLVPSGD